MDLKDLLILIPSYRRDLVLYKTLDGLLQNTAPSVDFEVSICVGLNAGREYERELCWLFQRMFGLLGLPFVVQNFKENVGKAAALNDMFNRQNGQDWRAVVTMDNDMVVKKPYWLKIIKKAMTLDLDMIGFSSANFWAHLPKREECKPEPCGNYTLYRPYGVAGGMLLFKPSILVRHPWTNHGGVYGRDDATMCEVVENKAVLHSDNDWLDHDPWARKTEELQRYDSRKKALYAAGTMVFHEGWEKE